MRKVIGRIYANSCTRNSNSLALAIKALYWKNTKVSKPAILTSFDNKEESLSGNQDNSGKNLAFFLKTSATTAENPIENLISTSPAPTK